MLEDTSHLPDSSPDDQLDAVLADYLRRMESGEYVDRAALLKEHPHLADELREFFANQTRFSRVVSPPPQPSTAMRLRYFGDYELLDEIAHGGMGVVYKARQTSLNRVVAVKMILAGQLANDGEVKRFQAEAEAAANLHHPGVVAIYEVGIHAGQHYFSMEYVEGPNLAQLMRDQPVPASRAAEYLREMAEVVDFAHNQGVLHRDLKPSNILIDPHGRVRITDFGLAKKVAGNSDLTITGQVIGTPSYMSPEQSLAQHHRVGPASDIYALGAIFYELITGRPPFRSETPTETMRQVQQDEPVRPRLLNPKLPRDLETICLKCLEKESQRRYASAKALADELGRFLQGEPILARPLGSLARAARWTRRHAWAVGSSATIAILLAAIMVGGIYGLEIWRQWAILQDSQRVAEAQQLAAGDAAEQHEAIRLLSLVIEHRGADAALYRQRALLHYDTGDSVAALADCRAAHERGETSPACKLLLVASALEVGEHQAAKAETAELARAAPGGVEAVLAEVLTNSPTHESLARLNAAFQGAPDDSRHSGYRAQATLHILQHQGSKPAYDQATALLQQALRRRPHDLRTLKSLCLCWIGFHFLADVGDHPLDKARKEIDAWLNDQPNDWRPLALLGLWHVEREGFVQAELVSKQGRGKFPNRPEFAHVLAVALGAQQNRPAAERAFDMAANLWGARRNTLWPMSQLQLVAERAVNAESPTGSDWTQPFAAPLAEENAMALRHSEWRAVAEAFARSAAANHVPRGNAAPWCARWRQIAPECPTAYDIRVAGVDTGAIYSQAIKLGPSLRAARLGRAAEHERDKRFNEARQEYEVYLQLSPGDERGLIPLATLYAECPDRAQRDLVQAQKLAAEATAALSARPPAGQNTPLRSQAWQLLARIERYAGNYAPALAALNAAAELEPEKLAIRLEQCRVLLDQGLAERARTQLDEFLLSRPANYQELQSAASVLSYSSQADIACGRRALELLDQAAALLPKQISATDKGKERQILRQLQVTRAIAHYRAGDWEQAAAELPQVAEELDPFVRAMILWRTDKPAEARALYEAAAHQAGADLMHFDWRQRARCELRTEAARLLDYAFDETAVQRDIATHQVRPGDYTQLGRWGARNNVVENRALPETWNPGKFDRKTGVWDATTAQNVKWVAQLGSQAYGNPVVANGRVLVGTNNSAGHLQRFPANLDMGVLLCFRESDGELLWQYTCDKLPTGRVHDWPLMGICSAPLLERDRAWLVSSQGKVLCMDMAGFRDKRDDGLPRPTTYRLFRTEVSRLNQLDQGGLGETLNEDLHKIQWSCTPACSGSLQTYRSLRSIVIEPGRKWKIVWSYNLGHKLGTIQGDRYFDVELVGDQLLCQVRSVGEEAPIGSIVRLPAEIYPPPDVDGAIRLLQPFFNGYGIDLQNAFAVEKHATSTEWSFQVEQQGRKRRFTLIRNEHMMHCVEQLVDIDPQEADVLWEFDMMKELGISQHNMCTCPPTCWGHTLFICTSNGVDESHVAVAAPQAPSFIAMDKHTGKVLWTDNSPGANIQHGQWSGPAVGVLGGVPQVIFPGGDGWVYSFHAADHADGKPQLLWKFDVNPKDAVLELGGRGTRNEVIALPMIYDGRVYVSTGQDPEHGEGRGELWCLDPTKRGDISRQLVVDRNDRNRVIPHRRVRAILPEMEEILIDNPNSGVIWNYNHVDHNGDREEGFEEVYHRSLSSVAIKNDLLIAADFSGLVHCLNAKTGQVYWQHDMLAAIWSSPLIVGNRIFMCDEDGDVTIFPLTPYARPDKEATAYIGVEHLAEINMINSVYTTPIVAGDTLYIANRSHLFAIGQPETAPVKQPGAGPK